MIELEQAVALAKQHLTPQTKTEHLPIEEAFGRVTAHELLAPIAVPNFERSGMDGYAVFAEDTLAATPDRPVYLTVQGSLFAGDDPAGFQAKPGTTVRIMTGGAIPKGYNAVVKQELTDYGEKTVAIQRAVTVGQNFAPIGEDIRPGQMIFPAHSRLNCESIGVLASLGLTEIEVLRPLRVGLLATGNELAQPGQALQAGQVYNSTTFALAQYLRQSGSQVVFRLTCPDDPNQFVQILQQYADQVDLIITTGGVSVGQRDFIPGAIRAISGTELFHFVQMKPGTPLMAATWQHKVILALSGNPFASMVNFHLLYWPLLAHFLGNQQFNLQQRQVPLLVGDSKPRHLRNFMRGQLTPAGVKITPGGHHSSVFHNLVDSNCLIEQPRNQALALGQTVTVYQWPQS